MNNNRLHNFGAGPCILPQDVLDQAAEAVRYWPEARLSLLEVSHRHPAFLDVVAQTKLLVREILDVPDDYHVLFLQGGASTQFAMIPMNFLNKTQTAAFLDSGFFAQKAIGDAALFGQTAIVASSKDHNYNYIPRDYAIPAEAAYFHITSNNTIEGTQMPDFPDCGIPLFCDMSSDIFSRRIDVRKFDLIYAGAQKNMGPAGMTLVILKKSLLDHKKSGLATMLDYQVHIDHASIYNTPPVFAIYTAMLNLKWLKAKGGLAVQEVENKAKAGLLYRAINESSLFKGFADKNSRSFMNVTFNMQNSSAESDFLAFADERSITAIKGYPTIGGFRASLYNALTMDSVAVLADAIKDFVQIYETTTI
jgi:phosphoserine aminotransferase